MEIENTIVSFGDYFLNREKKTITKRPSERQKTLGMVNHLTLFEIKEKEPQEIPFDVASLIKVLASVNVSSIKDVVNQMQLYKEQAEQYKEKADQLKKQLTNMKHQSFMEQE